MDGYDRLRLSFYVTARSSRRTRMPSIFRSYYGSAHLFLVCNDGDGCRASGHRSEAHISHRSVSAGSSISAIILRNRDPLVASRSMTSCVRSGCISGSGELRAVQLDRRGADGVPFRCSIIAELQWMAVQMNCLATGIARLLVLAVLFGKICFCEKCGYSALVEKITR
jgi:hypothetical protein